MEKTGKTPGQANRGHYFDTAAETVQGEKQKGITLVLQHTDMEIEAKLASQEPINRVPDSQVATNQTATAHQGSAKEGRGNSMEASQENVVPNLLKMLGTSPSKPGSYAAAARPGFERDSDQDAEDDEAVEDDEDEILEQEEEENPYDRNLDFEAGAHMSHKDLKVTLAHLPKVPESVKPGMRVEFLDVDKEIIASRLFHLQKRGVILYTVDFNPCIRELGVQGNQREATDQDRTNKGDHSVHFPGSSV